MERSKLIMSAHRRRNKFHDTGQNMVEAPSSLVDNDTAMRLGILSNPSLPPQVVLKQVNPSYLSSQALRLSLWDAFVEYVHPYVPVMEIDSCGEQTIDIFSLVMERKLSSLIYLSIMYAGIPHLDAEGLRLSGFDSYVALGKAMRNDYKVSSTPLPSVPYSSVPVIAPVWAFKPLGVLGVFFVAHEFMVP